MFFKNYIYIQYMYIPLAHIYLKYEKKLIISKIITTRVCKKIILI